MGRRFGLRDGFLGGNLVAFDVDVDSSACADGGARHVHSVARALHVGLSSAGFFLHLARIQERGHGNIADGRHVIRTKPAYVNRRHGGCRERIALSILDGSLVRGARRSLQALLAGRDLVIAIVRETLRTVRSACFRHVPLGSLHIKRIVATGIGYIRRSMIRGLARLGETSGAFAVGCIKSACETRALHRLVCVTRLLRLLLSFLEPVRNPVARSARLAHGIVRRCRHAGRCRRNGGRLLGGATSFLGSCSLGVRQSLLHGILGNAGQRFARLVAQLSIAFVSSRRQRGFFDLDEVLSDIRRCNP